MSFPRIKYNNINIDFDRYFNEYYVISKETRTQNESTGGHIETVDFFERKYVSAAIRRLKGQIVNQLKKWWEYVKNGSSFSLWWDRCLGLYCDFEGLEVKSTDGDEATFSRNDAEYYEEIDQNIDGDVKLTLAADGEPRMPEGKFGRGLLIEKTIFNRLTRSSEFDHADWTKTNVTVNADTTEVLDPTGNNNADKLTASAAGGFIKQDTIQAVGNDDACFSIYLKAVISGTQVSMIILNDNGDTKISGVKTLTNCWARYYIAYNNPGDADANNWRVRLVMDNNGDILYAYGAQLENGTDVLRPTGYIETVAVTSRNAESCYFSVTSGVNFPHHVGTISFWAYPNYTAADVQTRYFIYGRNSGGNHSISFKQHTDGTYIFSLVDTQGSNIFALVLTGSYITIGAWNYIVLRWDETNVDIFINGVNRATDAYTAKVARETDRIYFGSNSTPSNQLDGIIDDFVCHLEAISDDEILARYSANRALGFQKNYFSALKVEDSEYEPVLNVGGLVYDFELNAIEDLNS